MSLYKDLAQQKFGRLTAIKYLGNSRWFCSCDCGSTTIVNASSLLIGKTKSCGCLKVGQKMGSGITHNMSRTRLYREWANMKSRINYPSRHNYHRYGGRGIRYCNEWEKFEPFMNWALSNGYSDNLTLDRKNSDGNYEPSNCMFSTHRVQQQRIRHNHNLTIDDKTQSIAMWADECGISITTISARIRNGWTDADAIKIPINSKYINKKYLK